MSLVDIGANLTHESFAHNLTKTLDEARAAGVEKLVVTGASLQGSREAAMIAKAHPAMLLATAGIHPHHGDEATADVMAEIRTLLDEDCVRAVGETGLDFFRDFCDRSVQIKSFEKHIELAMETGLPMFLHERDAYPTFFEVLAPYRDKLSQVVVHCFTGDETALRAYLDIDCHIGITGWVCDERRGQHLLPLLKLIPEDRLMIETDSPYLQPRTLRPKPKSRINKPKYLAHICQFIADQLGCSYETVADRTSKNAAVFFGFEA